MWTASRRRRKYQEDRALLKKERRPEEVSGGENICPLGEIAGYLLQWCDNLETGDVVAGGRGAVLSAQKFAGMLEALPVCPEERWVVPLQLKNNAANEDRGIFRQGLVMWRRRGRRALSSRRIRLGVLSGTVAPRNGCHFPSCRDQ